MNKDQINASIQQVAVSSAALHERLQAALSNAQAAALERDNGQLDRYRAEAASLVDRMVDNRVTLAMLVQQAMDLR